MYFLIVSKVSTYTKSNTGSTFELPIFERILSINITKGMLLWRVLFVFKHISQAKSEILVGSLFTGEENIKQT